MANDRRPEQVVSLSVHRNTREQRRRHATTKDLRDSVRFHTRQGNVMGYVLVSWNADGNIVTSWYAGQMKASQLPGFAQSAIQRELSIGDVRNAVDSPPANPDDEPA